MDGDGNPIKNKTVSVKFNDKVTKLTTNARGFVFYKLGTVGTYTLTYSFKADGYAPIKVSKKISVVSNTVSKLKGSNYVAYVGVKNPFTVTLTTGGVNLPNQKVVFTFKGKKYTKTTNSKGVATLNINTAKKGTYTVKYSFKAVKNAKSASGKAKITVKKGMPTSITNQKIYVYRPNVVTPFVIKYRDARGDPIASKTIEFTINKKTYKVKTDSKGLAQVKIKQKRGSYTLKVRSYNTAAYKGVTNTYSIRVIPEHVNYDNYGFWLFGGDMKNVNLKTMAKNGINHIFLNFYAVDLYGKSGVSSFAKEASSLGIKVHIWMQVFYRNGGWVSPVNNDGSYKYSLFNTIIKEAKDYAKIDGISGIHLDYLRFPGTAHKHTNGMKAVNYFTKKICNELHAMNSKLIVSAAVMPEPSSMKYYYGQDIATISQYLDVIVPMVYKGNYNQGTSWIKSVTSTFVGQSKGADIWTGLQSYYSDSYVKKLPASSLRHDAVYGISGGATGIILFRYSLFNIFDFATL
ncbi:putative glycoside hydrolase [Methanobrevibacter sp.]|uniref:putative glycoside hydrolase n=1 Tax=Methanobrevibacter sp. TaxID=66852 RepID=UPI00388E20C5